MPNQNVNQQIGNAWKLHREGENSTAISEFRKVMDHAPDSVDAHYGLGLALRADGDESGSAEAFQKAYQLCTDALIAVRKVSGSEGGIGNNLGSTEDDRYMMLTRMLQQRLVEMGIEVDA